MADPLRKHAHLHLLDPETGEVTEQACPYCAEWERTYQELERKYKGLLSQLGNMRKDRDAEAQGHALWPQAVTLWWEWKVASGRWRSKWSTDRFELVMPYLRDDGFALCRHAVWGVCAHPYVEQITPTYSEVHNKWETCFGDRGKFERYASRGVAIFGKELPIPPATEGQR